MGEDGVGMGMGRGRGGAGRAGRGRLLQLQWAPTHLPSELLQRAHPASRCRPPPPSLTWPQVKANAARIYDELAREEGRFVATLEAGEKILREVLERAAAGSGTVSGAVRGVGWGGVAWAGLG